MSAPVRGIDCPTCRQWAVHCTADLEAVFVQGHWHHPAHAEDLLRARHRVRVAPAVVLPSGERCPIAGPTDGGDGEPH